MWRAGRAAAHAHVCDCVQPSNKTPITNFLSFSVFSTDGHGIPICLCVRADDAPSNRQNEQTKKVSSVCLRSALCARNEPYTDPDLFARACIAAHGT